MGRRKTMKRPTSTPPRFALRFFRWFCNDHLSDAVLGDMLELYERRVKKSGKRKADLLFFWNVITFLQPFAFRNKNQFKTVNNLAMLHNYFIVTWRSMMRQKMYTLIKLGGFALGLATCFVIFLFIRNELSFDASVPQHTYRVYNDYRGPDGGSGTSFPASMASIIKADFPEIENSARLIPYQWYNAGDNLFRRDDQVDNAFEEGFAYADQALLEILNIPMVYGRQENALAKPNSIVIAKSIADKYFPGTDPTGKLIVLNEDKAKPFTIGGVMDDFPPNSHIRYNFFITLTNVEFWDGEQTSWCCWNYNVYVRIRPDANPADLENKMLAVRDKHYVGFLKQAGNAAAEDVRKYHYFKLQPVKDIYLKSAGIDDVLQHGDIRYIWLFGGVAVFILLLACINFINLSTARSANRAKEVGVRKVVGSVRGYIVNQFLTESLFYSFLSFVIAILLAWISLPYFNQLAGKTLFIPWTAWWLYPGVLAAAVLIGLLAGLYPSFYLSGFKPIDVLKGSVSRGSKKATLRNAMVVFQFTTSIVLIIGTVVIYRQMDYVMKSKIGFDKEQVVLIQGANTLDKRQAEFRNELKTLSPVTRATISNYYPVSGTKRDQNGFWKEGRSKIDKEVGAQRWHVDEDYITTLGIKIIEGRNFDPAIASDSNAIIINQTMARELGLKNPVGERIQNWQAWNVIGVVEDFNFESMKGKIGPLSLTFGHWGSIAAVKVNTDDMPATIIAINQVWNKFLPHQPFRYKFLDESYAQMYADVQRMGSIFGSFALLAVIVACLGLFALSAFMVEQRTKEISIRLVLGAPVNNILRLLTQNFVVLVMISFVLAAPVAWYIMTEWLLDFEYKTTITWDVFVIAGGISMMIALLTVSYQSVKAALVNPVKNLRSE